MLRIQTILFPTDFSEAAEKALDVARSLARDHQAKLVLVHTVSTLPTVDVYIPDNELETLRTEARGHLNALAARVTDVPVEIQVPFGEPGATIVSLARMLSADLIIMGTNGRSGLTRMLLGSVAEYVLRHAPCPVLTIKPGTEQQLQHHTATKLTESVAT